MYVSLIGVRGFDGHSSGASLNYTLSPANYGEAAPADQVNITLSLFPLLLFKASKLIDVNVSQTKDSIDGHLLISRDVVLSLCLDVPLGSSIKSEEIVESVDEPVEDANQAMTVSYYAEFDCRELPEEGYMQLELIGKNEGQLYADLKFVIKVTSAYNAGLFTWSYNLFIRYIIQNIFLRCLMMSSIR